MEGRERRVIDVQALQEETSHSALPVLAPHLDRVLSISNPSVLYCYICIITLMQIRHEGCQLEVVGGWQKLSSRVRYRRPVHMSGRV